jgi:uncharacterized membrane protein
MSDNERDASAAVWGIILFGCFVGVLAMEGWQMVIAAIPFWLMTLIELIRKDAEELNLVKVIGFGFAPLTAILAPPVAPFMYAIIFMLWGLFVFIEREDEDRVIDSVIAIPVMIGALVALFPEHIYLFIASQFAIYGIIMLWKGRL